MNIKFGMLIYIFSFLIMGLFLNQSILADDAFIINNNTNIGEAQYVDEEYIGIQFTRTRQLTITLKDLDPDEKSDFHDIEICEYGDETSGSIITDTCRNDYDFSKTSFDYQISTLEQNKSKYIGVSLQKPGNSTWEQKGIREIILKTSGPALTLNGNEAILLSRGVSYTEPDPSYFVDDKYTLSHRIEINVTGLDFDTDDYGTTNLITYEAIDFLGNRTQVQRSITIEERAGLGINVRIIVGAVMGVTFIGALVYINLMQKKQREKKKSVLERKRPDILK